MKKTAALMLLLLATPGAHADTLDTVCHEALERMRSGETLTQADLDRCQDAWVDWTEALTTKYGISKNYKFPEPVRTDYYLKAVRMSIIHPEQHGGWPFRSSIRHSALDEMKKRLRNSDDPFLAYAALFPVFDRGDTKYGVELFAKLLEQDEFLAQKALGLGAAHHQGASSALLRRYTSAKGRADTRKVADLSGRSGHLRDLEFKASLFEYLEDYPAAEKCYRDIQEKHDFCGGLVSFYTRFPDELDRHGVPFRQRRDELQQTLFPQGLRDVELVDFAGPPPAGVVFTEDAGTWSEQGLKQGTVIVALDGRHVESLQQYYFVRDLAADNPRMSLIVWDGRAHQQVDVTVPKRRFGIDLFEFPVRDVEPDPAEVTSPRPSSSEVQPKDKQRMNRKRKAPNKNNNERKATP